MNKITKFVDQFSDLGKIPPQEIKFEEFVLGSLMLDKNAIYQIIEILNPNVFYTEENKIICQSILDLHNKNEPINTLTISKDLRKKAQLETVGGAYHLSELTDKIGSTSNIDYYYKIIVEKYIAREIIRISTEMKHKAYDETIDIFDLQDEFHKEVNSLDDIELGENRTKSSKDFNMIDSFQPKESGITAIDTIIGGILPLYTIIASRPSMGKTATIVQLAKNRAKKGDKILIFSLEMDFYKLSRRFIIGDCPEIQSGKFILNKFTKDEEVIIAKAIEEFKKLPIFIDDNTEISLHYIKNRIRKEKPDMVFLDYIQLMHDKSQKHQNREQEVSKISRELVAMRKNFGIPFIILAQMGREIEKRIKKIPILSDLKESGSLEQDADQVIFIHRPEQYGIYQDEKGNSTKGKGYYIVAKNRDGATGKGLFTYNESLSIIK